MDPSGIGCTPGWVGVRVGWVCESGTAVCERLHFLTKASDPSRESVYFLTDAQSVFRLQIEVCTVALT